MPDFLEDGDTLIGVAGAILALSSIVSGLFSVTFCNKPAPRWVRNYMMFCAAMVGVRWFTRMSLALTWDLTAVGVIFLGFASSVLIAAIYNIRYALTYGNQCDGERPDGPFPSRSWAWIVLWVAVLIACLVLLARRLIFLQ